MSPGGYHSQDEASHVDRKLKKRDVIIAAEEDNSANFEKEKKKRGR